MIKTPEQFVEANKAAVDALLSVANTALSSAERIAALNLNTARSMLETGVANAKALIVAKDPQESIKLSVAQAQPVVEQVAAYSRSLYEISAQSKEEISKLLESQFGDFQKQVSSLIETAAKNAPVGSDVAVAAVKSALEAANASFGNMKNIVEQTTEIAEANIVQASKVAGSIGKK
ncbi:phasin family protein [Propionivibrio sp.]|uniref:phasin family protein n=1 Tax=Propionivibrio sp. TaxID=2212460 RepID=UPI003BEF6358